MDHFVEAQVIDSRHLRLKKPIKIAPGSTVLITIGTAEDTDKNQEWFQLSSQGLAGAYGEDEPDYSLERIMVPNPDYRS